MSKIKSTLASSFTGTIYLFLLQLFSRSITFILNQILLRFTTAKVLGIVNIKLELILETILFISREGIRMALLRSKSSSEEIDKKNEEDNNKSEKDKKSIKEELLLPIQKAVNLSYIPIIIGCSLTILVTCYFNRKQNSNEDSNSSIILYSVAALIELVSEPLYILTQYYLMFNIRVKAEGVAVFIRSISSFIFTIYLNYKNKVVTSRAAVLCFAWSQLLYSIFLFGTYSFLFWKKYLSVKKNEELDTESLHLSQGIKAFLPSTIIEKTESGEKRYFFDEHLLSLSITLYIQSFVKYLLSQGDKIILNILCNTTTQGVYAFVMNYGSLILRIVFQPLEETCRIYFSKELVSKTSTKSSRQQVYKVIMTILKCHFILGMYFIFFATNYTGVLIDLLTGSNWSRNSSAPKALAYYCVSIPFMGFNGILEGFVQAVAPKKELHYQSRMMTIFWIIFAVCCFVFVKVFHMGIVGIIIGNMINMFLRIYSCYQYLINCYKKSEDQNKNNDIKEIHPFNTITKEPLVWGCFIGSWIICRILNGIIGWETLKQKAIFIFIGMILALVSTAILYLKEKNFLKELREYYRILRS
ncbi:Rft-1-domain-containing protein [Anaeromyces robustus]|uniref:Man(5)GlcNAc(2)-PP-dolichol translocation protein RFT1 n=1 Tax=Anaeromyces robustus TaxID=1754192 RepID=A0A1Y1XKA1_9FUNG|nr:Rft-1-domain-containing protein [Anaeromyces robustus]|eukprot:ORX86142.1 Rft-1-domain-containing protein [Anaeromyces robustus]